MSATAERAVPAGKPVTLLVIISTTAMLALAWLAHAARRDGRCGLSLPWSRETSEALLQTVFRTAWGEAQTLRRVSSACMAQLHVDFASSFLAVLAASLVGAVVICVRYGVIAGKVHVTAMDVKAVAGIIILPLVSYWVLNGTTLIDFAGKSRKMPAFDGAYVNPFSYALYVGVALLTLVIGVLGLAGLIGIARRGRRAQT